jgi:hypothetical protein
MLTFSVVKNETEYFLKEVNNYNICTDKRTEMFRKTPACPGYFNFFIHDLTAIVNAISWTRFNSNTIHKLTVDMRLTLCGFEIDMQATHSYFTLHS